MRVEVDLLGPLRVRSETEIEIERPSLRRLLSILALDAGRRISTDSLIDRFWGESPPATAKAALQTHVSALRKTLGDAVIATEGYGYRLDLDGGTVDCLDFERLAGEARSHVGALEWELALEVADTALGLWRGDALDEIRDHDFARPQAVRLEELRLETVELRLEALIALGRKAEALPDLEALVMEHPLRERLWEHLMTARYRLGRHADAVRAFRRVEGILGEIGLEPGASLRRLEEKALLHDRELNPITNNLPVELSRFIGRDRELTEAAKLLAEHRLVTLTGVGGSGKTRLGLRLASESLDAFPDGVWYVELAALREPARIATELARAIGLSPSGADTLDALKRVLAGDQALVVLDNCEHLAEGAASLARTLLEAVPRLKVVATSRQRLHIPGEATYEVPGLGIPGEDRLRSAREADAVRLFIDRVSLIGDSRDYEEGDLEDVVTICRRLDGLPLAIELAAGRAATLSPHAIADRLGDRLSLLSGGAAAVHPRHQTLEAAIDWSYQLLSGSERKLINRLSVFRGGFDLEMAEAVCAGGGADVTEIAPLLADLVEKSLVARYQSPVGRRHRLLEAVRDFARSRLEEAAEVEPTRDRHRDWCVEFASGFRRRWLAPGRDLLMTRVEEESDNLLAALEWAQRSGDDYEAGLLCEPLDRFWYNVGQASRSLECLRTALMTAHRPDRLAYLRAQLCSMLWYSNDPVGALDQARSAYELAKGGDPSPEKVHAIGTHGHMYMMAVDEDPAIALASAEESLEMARQLGDAHLEVIARRSLGNALSWNGQSEAGIAAMEEALVLARESGDPEAIYDAYKWTLHVMYLDPVARRHRTGTIVDEILDEFPVEDPRWAARLAADWPAWALIQKGDFDRAESLLAAVENRHVESFNLVAYRLERGTLYWMRGDLEKARSDLRDCEREGINPRWYHDYYPLLVDVLVDRGQLERAESAARFYLDADVHASEQVKKAGVLNPLVRGMVERALVAPAERDDLIAAARASVADIEQLIERFPPPTRGSISMETPWTHLALARAELSRLTGPDPDEWREAVGLCDYLYFRLYARIRLAEALSESGDRDAGSEELRSARSVASDLGAALLCERAEAIGARFRQP